MLKTEPYLSVVVVSRNDDHGGNLLQRMQLFVAGWLEQAKRYNLNSELIIVEWNPLLDRPRLSQALKWPEKGGPCSVRIIEVPPEVHQRFQYADKLPLFQMIGKNVGIRRARGRFVLATNIDILFSDELMEHISSEKLVPDRMYRIDRYDVPSDVPEDATIDEQLQYCRDNVIRINGKRGTLVLVDTEQSGKKPVSIYRSFWNRFKASRSAGDIKKLFEDVYDSLFKVTLFPVVYGRQLHTNACGDFTMMAREHWLAFRGNAEFEMYSFYLDGLMCAVAHYGGVKECVLEEPMRIYHIEHAPGSGWMPGVGAKLLEERLKKSGIPQLTNKEYLRYIRRIRWHRGIKLFNGEDWGLGAETLKDEVVLKADWEES